MTTIRSLEDIRVTGAAWVTEHEIEWMADEIERLRAENVRMRSSHEAMHRLLGEARGIIERLSPPLAQELD